MLVYKAILRIAFVFSMVRLKRAKHVIKLRRSCWFGRMLSFEITVA